MEKLSESVSSVEREGRRGPRPTASADHPGLALPPKGLGIWLVSDQGLPQGHGDDGGRFRTQDARPE